MSGIHNIFGLQDKVAVVTGGTSGIGLATVRLLLARGAKVAFCSRDQQRLTRTLQSLEREYGADNTCGAQCDVLDETAVAQFAEDVGQQWGQVDVLIANAGQGYVAGLEETPRSAWLSEAELKLFGLLNPFYAFRERLKRSDIGSITCVNSLLARQPEPHMIATSASRAALLNMTHSLARELINEGTRVNSILLGMVESAQWYRRFEARDDKTLNWEQWSARIAQRRGIPLGRLGKPDEAAQALVFLASPLAAYTTGAVLDVSGGFSHQI